MNKLINKLLYIFLFLFLLSSCKEEQPELVNLDIAKKLVAEYYESGKFDEECKVIFDNAIEKVNQLRLDVKPTAIFDVDETALSNYDHIKEIGFGYIPDQWNEWINKGDAKAILHTKNFYDFLVSKEIKIVFLTGRPSISYDATKRNLIEQGYTKFDTLITRSEEDINFTAVKFKTSKKNRIS